MMESVALKGRFTVLYKGRMKKHKINLEGKNLLNHFRSVLRKNLKIKKDFHLEYLDSDNVFICLDTDDELLDAREEMERAGKPLKFRIKMPTVDLSRNDSKEPNFDQKALIQEHEKLEPVDLVFKRLPRLCGWPIVGLTVLTLLAVVAIGLNIDIQESQQAVGKKRIETYGSHGETSIVIPDMPGPTPQATLPPGATSSPTALSFAEYPTPQPLEIEEFPNPFVTTYPTPGFANEKVIYNISDAQYGIGEAVFSQKRHEFWAENRKHMSEEQKFKRTYYHDYEVTKHPNKRGYEWVGLKKWEASRSSVCKKINDASDIAFPQKYRYDPSLINGGYPKGGLPFDPTIVKRHAQQFRNMLSEYYKDSKLMTLNMSPKQYVNDTRKGAPGYLESMDKLSNLFARKAVHGEIVRLTALGSSVIAGADNCAWYTYDRQLQRMLDPILKAANSGFESRNSGQNGDGGPAQVQSRCIDVIVGADSDIVQFGWWMVLAPFPQIHENIRRLLSEGILPHFNSGVIQDGITDTSELIEYYKMGLMALSGTGDWQKSLVGQGTWWPGLNKAHWGRQGDNFCHRETREGGPGVLFYNWHPGPLGFQVMADNWAYRYSLAIVMAMEKLESAIEAGKNLKKEFPKSRPSLGTLPKNIACGKKHGAKTWMCKKGVFDQGFKSVNCSIGQYPQWGNGGLASWAYKTDENGRVTSEKYKFHETKYRGKEKEKGKWTHGVFKDVSPLGRSLHGADGTPPHSEYQLNPYCRHYDKGYTIQGYVNSGWIGFKLPAQNNGRILICSPVRGTGYSKGTYNVDFKLDGNLLPGPYDFNKRYLESCMKLVEDKNLAGKPHTLSIKVNVGYLDIFAIIVE